MEKKETFKLTRGNYFYIAMSGVILLLFSLLLIYPNYKALKHDAETIADLKHLLEEQQALFPFYNTLVEIQIKEQGNVTHEFVLPDEKALKRDDIQQIQDTFSQICLKRELTLQFIKPDVNSLLDNADQLNVKLTVSGDFFQFREFLRDVIRLPYYYRIENLQIEKPLISDDLQLKISVMLKVIPS